MYAEVHRDPDENYLQILRKSSYYKSLLSFDKINTLIIQNSVNLVIKRLNNLINQITYDHASRILPILISSGIDSSLLYYLTKNMEKNWKIIYIPNPPVDVRIFFHIYTCLIEELGSEVLEELSLNSGPHIERDEKSLEMIKLISKNTMNPLVLYFDEIDLSYRIYGEFAERKILESVKKLHHSIKNLIIILISSKELWTKLAEIAGPTIISTLEPELELHPFKLKDFKTFFTYSMEAYWEKNHVQPPSNPFFPLNENLIEIFFHETKANPRKFLKLCKKFIEKIGREEISLEELI